MSRRDQQLPRVRKVGQLALRDKGRQVQDRDADPLAKKQDRVHARQEIEMAGSVTSLKLGDTCPRHLAELAGLLRDREKERPVAANDFMGTIRGRKTGTDR